MNIPAVVTVVNDEPREVTITSWIDGREVHHSIDIKDGGGGSMYMGFVGFNEKKILVELVAGKIDSFCLSLDAAQMVLNLMYATTTGLEGAFLLIGDRPHTVLLPNQAPGAAHVLPPN